MDCIPTTTDKLDRLIRKQKNDKRRVWASNADPAIASGKPTDLKAKDVGHAYDKSLGRSTFKLCAYLWHHELVWDL